MSTPLDERALRAELAELEAANEQATSWGAAVGARLERIKDIKRTLDALPTPTAVEGDSLVTRLAVTEEMVERAVKAAVAAIWSGPDEAKAQDFAMRAALEAALSGEPSLIGLGDPENRETRKRQHETLETTADYSGDCGGEIRQDAAPQPIADAVDVAGLVEELRLYGKFTRSVHKERVAMLIEAAADALTRQSEQIVSLIKERDSWRRVSERLERERQTAESRLADLEQEAVKVVEPFVKHYEPWMDGHNDGAESMSYSRHTLGQLRAARAFLSKLKGSAS